MLSDVRVDFRGEFLEEWLGVCFHVLLQFFHAVSVVISFVRLLLSFLPK